ncbi:MAG TPA: tetratricopeptide repeat protein, partial [Blastocatellia bacterium]|nr:tetratricopeptide repeat protein [Blastocatellia bacterium]
MCQPRFRQPSSSTQPTSIIFSNIPAFLCCILLANSLLALHPQAFPLAQEATPLVLEQPITRELSGGETHKYQITLTAGQIFRGVVQQRGVNVVTTLFGPNGQKIAELDSPVGAEGSEPVSLIADTTGVYRLELQARQQNAPQGRYEIKVEEVRTATQADRDRVAAERAFADATITYQGSAESLRKGIEKYKQVIPLWQALRDRTQEAFTLNAIGLLYRHLGEYQQALTYHQQALQINQEVGNPGSEALTLYSIGAVYDHVGEPKKALDAYHKALAIFQQLGDRSMEAATLGNTGVVYSGLGEQQKALEYFQRALPIKQSLRDPNGEATLLNNIGLIHNYLGARQQALESYQRALPLYRALNDRTGEGTALNNIGTLYSEMGEYRKALDYLEQVLQIKREAGNRVEESIALNNLGVNHAYLGEQQKALQYYQQALPLSRGVPSAEATTLSNIGKANDDLGNHQKALDVYQQALRIKLEIGDRRGEAVTRTNIGRAYYGLGQWQKAIEYYQQALPLRQAVADRVGEAITLYNLALAQRALNQLPEAHTQSAAALAIVESLRSNVASQRLRTSYLASVQQYYELNIDLLMRLEQQRPAEGFAAAALQTSERARARSLLEMLAESRTEIRQGVAPDLLARERTLQQLLDTKAMAQTRLLNGKHTAGQAAAIAKELSDLTTEFEQVQAQIRRTSPRYAALTQPVPLSVQEIQTAVLDDDTLLLEYALGKEKSYLWAVTPTSLKSFVLPNRAEIEAAARRVYEALTARNQAPPNETPEQRQRRIDRADADFVPAAAALSQMLFSPVA